jgi:hypothetical protein
VAPWEELVGEAYATLRCAISDGVSSYRGGEVWGTHLGGFSRRGALEQGARQRGSSSDLWRRWWGASRGSSQRGRAKWVRRQLQITDVGLLELEKLLTRRGDGKGYLGLASVFLKILARGVIYLWGFRVHDLVRA